MVEMEALFFAIERSISFCTNHLRSGDRERNNEHVEHQMSVTSIIVDVSKNSFKLLLNVLHHLTDQV